MDIIEFEVGITQTSLQLLGITLQVEFLVEL